MDKENISKEGNNSNSIDIKELAFKCLSNWKWFVLSIIVTMGIGIFHLLRTPKEYTRMVNVLIKDDAQSNSLSSEFTQFAELGAFQTKSSVHNELVAFHSPALMTEVVRRLDLNTNYFLPGKFHKEVAYGKNLPINVKLVDFPLKANAKFTIDINPDRSLTIKNLEYNTNGEEQEADNEFKAHLMDTIQTPIGRVVVSPTENFKIEEATAVYVTRSNFYSTADSYTKRLSAFLNNEKTSVIDLTFNDTSIERAEDILNTIIDVYNENWAKDKNQIAVNTSKFINERLSVIEQELGNVDKDISSFKSKNLLPDVDIQSEIYLNQSSENKAQLIALSNQLYMANYIKDYISQNKGTKQLLPVNSGIGSQSIEEQITEYNKTLLTRNKLAANSSDENPLVTDLDNSINSLSKAIATSVDNQIVTIESQIKSLSREEDKTTSKIAASPEQAKYLISIERQQKVKEALYLYLLQKREENEISQAYSAHNTRIITPPSGSMAPISPKKGTTLFFAFIIGLFIPFGVIITKELMNTKIRGRKDLEGLPIPFMGEIPLYSHQKKGLFHKAQDVKNEIVVREGSRNIINEAFRVLRANLEFVMDDNKNSNVVIITSFNPGSGKSFVTMNTATTLAIKGKKVLVIDGDLRHASASSYINSPKEGISTYLANKIDNVKDAIVTVRENLDILPVGTIPPNPTELLYKGRFAELISSMKLQYDYILIDCPPIELVADTQIIAKFSDRTIFIVRAGMFERSMIGELEKLYDNKKYKNISIILNGTESAGNGNRYGYRYGYGNANKYNYGNKD